MRRCLLFLLFLGAQLHANPYSVDISADSVILINAETGAILYEKNSEKLQYPASLTKIATCAYTLDIAEDKLDRIVAAERDSIVSISEEEIKRSNYSFPSHWLVPGTSHIGIKQGEELSLEALLYGIMLPSGGDASNVVAQYIGGTVPQFMGEVNGYLNRIGCKNTHFKNPHGLHHPKHQSTAKDLAILTQEALKNETFRTIVRSVSYKRPDTNKQQATTLVQTNKLLKRGKLYYPKAIGVKTGYTSIAQNCLAAAAQQGDRTLIAVFLKCPSRDMMFMEAKKLFESVFKEKKEHKTILHSGIQKPALKLPKASSTVRTYIEEDLVIAYYPSEKPKLHSFLNWDMLELPIKQGEKVGEILIKDGDHQVVKKAILYAANDVDYSLSSKIFNWTVFLKTIVVTLAVTLIVAFALQLRK